MSGPALAGGLGLQALGTGMQMRNRNRAIRAQQQEYADEAARQSAFRERGAEEFQKSLAHFTRENVDQREADAIAGRQAASDAAVESAQIGAPVTDQPRVVKQAMARALVEGLDKGRDFGRRLSRIQAGSNTAFTDANLLNRAGEAINRLGREASASAQIAPIAAQSAFRNRFNPLPGDILSSIGQLGTLYSFSRPQVTPASGPGPGARGY